MGNSVENQWNLAKRFPLLRLSSFHTMNSYAEMKYFFLKDLLFRCHRSFAIGDIHRVSENLRKNDLLIDGNLSQSKHGLDVIDL